MKQILFAVGSVLAAPLSAQMTVHDVSGVGQAYRMSAALGDLDGDGIEDLLVSNNGKFEIRKGISRKPRRFAAPKPFGHQASPTCESACEPRLVDFDHDGDLDLLTVDAMQLFHQMSWAVWFANDGKGNFAKAVPITGTDGKQLQVKGELSAVDLHDWNGDGHDDLIVASPQIAVHLGGPAGFAIEPVVLGPKSRSFEVVDWNADGTPDLVTAPKGEVLLHLGVPGALLEPVVLSKVDNITCPVRLSIADWDADGLGDFLIGDHKRLPKAKVDAAEIAEAKAQLAAVDRILGLLQQEVETLNATRPPLQDQAAMKRRSEWRDQLAAWAEKPRALQKKLETKLRASTDPGSVGCIRALVR